LLLAVAALVMSSACATPPASKPATGSDTGPDPAPTRAAKPSLASTDPYQRAADELQALLKSAEPNPGEPTPPSQSDSPSEPTRPASTKAKPTKPANQQAARSPSPSTAPKVYEAPPPLTPSSQELVSPAPQAPAIDEPDAQPAPPSPPVLASPAPEPSVQPTQPGPAAPASSTAAPHAASAEPHPFRITALHPCTRIEAFGRFTKADLSRLPANRATPILLYTELDAFSHRTAAGLAPPPDAANTPDDGSTQWIIQIAQEVAVFSAAGRLQFKVPEQLARDEAKRRRRDHYLVQRLTIPATLPPGSYAIVVTARDIPTGATDQARIPFTVVAKGAAR
jgi:hypothetical protein